MLCYCCAVVAVVDVVVVIFFFKSKNYQLNQIVITWEKTIHAKGTLNFKK